jgi:hypothetical protein
MWLSDSPGMKYPLALTWLIRREAARMRASATLASACTHERYQPRQSPMRREGRETERAAAARGCAPRLTDRDAASSVCRRARRDSWNRTVPWPLASKYLAGTPQMQFAHGHVQSQRGNAHHTSLGHVTYTPMSYSIALWCTNFTPVLAKGTGKDSVSRMYLRHKGVNSEERGNGCR